MGELVTTVLNAATLISILMLVALGLAVIYGLMGVINMAHGEFVTVGAYSLVLAHSLGLGFVGGLLLAVAIGYALGALLQWALVRHIQADPVATILATWGVSLVLRQLLQLLFGAAPQPVSSPWAGAVSVLGTPYPGYRLLLVGMAVVVMLACLAFFRRTAIGLDMRAILQNRAMAESLGVPTRRVFVHAFGLGAALAAVAGVLLAPLAVVVPHMGINHLARSFLVVIVGGSGQVAGVAAGSGLIGGIESLLAWQMPTSIAQGLVLVMAVVLIRFRPQGLTGAKSR